MTTSELNSDEAVIAEAMTKLPTRQALLDLVCSLQTEGVPLRTAVAKALAGLHLPPQIASAICGALRADGKLLSSIPPRSRPLARQFWRAAMFVLGRNVNLGGLFAISFESRLDYAVWNDMAEWVYGINAGARRWRDAMYGAGQ